MPPVETRPEIKEDQSSDFGFADMLQPASMKPTKKGDDWQILRSDSNTGRRILVNRPTRPIMSDNEDLIGNSFQKTDNEGSIKGGIIPNMILN